MDAINEWSEEAICERDPGYRLPAEETDTVPTVPLTARDRQTWQWMVAVRPTLACVS
jgi:hypothetical protein